MYIYKNFNCKSFGKSLVFLFILPLNFGISHSAQPNGTGSIIIPVVGMAIPGPILEDVHIEITLRPEWLKIQPSSFLGPTPIYPNEIINFRIDYIIGSNFSPPTPGEIEYLIKVSSPIITPSYLKWNSYSNDGFTTYRGQCINSENIQCGSYISPDKTSPETSIRIDGNQFKYAADIIYISTSNKITFEIMDPVVENSSTSETAFTGYAFDTSVFGFSQLTETTGPITLHESHRISFASRDYADNEEPIQNIYVLVDGTAPGKPETPAISGTTWKNTKEYHLTWTNPADVSGIAGVRVKFGGAAPVSNDEGTFYPADNSLDYSAPDAVNGINPIWLWLEDNVGNADPATAVQLTLRYDGIPPVSNAVSPSTSSSAIVPVSFNSSDDGAPDTGSGVDKTVLWHRNNGVAWSSGTYTPGGLSGTFDFDTQGIDGLREFYTQAFDKAGNIEPAPGPDTAAKAQTFVDLTAPVITGTKATAFSPDTAVIEWTTDDETTAVIDYGRTASLGSRFSETTSSKTHNVTLTGLPNPADIYFKITATNRTGLKTRSKTRKFKTGDR